MSARPAGEAAWQSALAVSYTDEAFAATGQSMTQAHVVRFLTLDTSHPGSIARCLDMARNNARAVRTALTRARRSVVVMFVQDWVLALVVVVMALACMVD